MRHLHLYTSSFATHDHSVVKLANLFSEGITCSIVQELVFHTACDFLYK